MSKGDPNQIGTAGRHGSAALDLQGLGELLEDPLLQKLEAGKMATFIIFQTPEEGIGIPISLNGFGDGFAALP